MKQKRFSPILIVAIVAILGGIGFWGLKTQTQGWKLYKNDTYHYSIRYPNNAFVFAPDLDERNLLEKGKLSENNLQTVQFRKNNNDTSSVILNSNIDKTSLLFNISVIKNPKNLPAKDLLISQCEQWKKEGDPCPDTKYEEYKMPDGTNAVISTVKVNSNLTSQYFYYPENGFIITIAFGSGDQNTQDQVIKSFKKIK